MENTEHILLVENGAQKFALDNGIPVLPPGTLNKCNSITSYYSSDKDYEYCTDRKNMEKRDNNDGEWYNEKQNEYDSDYIMMQSKDGKANPYCTISIDSEKLLDEPSVLKVCFIFKFLTKRKYLIDV